jgi:PPOX class probable F420-dependent enzyme
MTFDESTEFGKRTLDRLENEQIVWLTTVDENGTPQPVPVWFLWNGSEVLIYSKPNTPKLKNIARQSAVSLNFDSNGTGGNIIVFAGHAKVSNVDPPAPDVPDYVEKYRSGIKSLQMTPESFGASYSVPIRVTLTHLRGH